MSVRIGIMGFGRIGRNIFRLLYEREDIEIVAIVDTADPKGLEYLLRFDTVLGPFREPIRVENDIMYAKGRQIRMITAKAPGDVDWASLGVSVVVEATGKYRTRKELERHLTKGARNVILTVPPETTDDVDMVFVRGINHEQLKASDRIVSIGSCAIQAVAPVLDVVLDNFGIEFAYMCSVHAYTNDMRLADVPGLDMRRSRAAAENIIPTDSDTPVVLERLLPQLKGKVSASALGVPVPDGSNIDLTVGLSRKVTREEINEVMRSASLTRFSRNMDFSEDPLVSSDVVGNTNSAVFDSLSTFVMDGDLAKMIVWYDNGWAYGTRVVDLIGRMLRLQGETTQEMSA